MGAAPVTADLELVEAEQLRGPGANATSSRKAQVASSSSVASPHDAAQGDGAGRLPPPRRTGPPSPGRPTAPR